MLKELYSASEVEPMYFESELERNASFLILNSSLYYVFWLTYGDFHHLNWSHIDPFPVPDEETLKEHEDKITELIDELGEEMSDHFYEDRGRTGEFEMRPVKLVIDKVNDLLQDLYDLSEEQVEFAKNYLTDCGPDNGRIGPTDEDVRTYAEAESDD